MERAVELIFHTLRLIFDNIRQALHITLPGVLVLVIIVVVADEFTGSLGPSDSAVMVIAAFLFFLLAIPLFGMIFSAIAAAWHRYVLLDESPRGLFPLKFDRNASRYLFRSLKIGVLLLLAAILPLFIIGPMLTNFGNRLLSGGATAADFISTSFAMLLLSIILMYFFTRLVVCLPAVVLGREDFSVTDGWRATASMSGAIFWLVIITGTVNWLVTLGLSLPFQSYTPPFAVEPPLVVTIITLIWQWFAFMFSICIITTLYGIAVEGREI